jgi:16S rRNA (cytosine967-C5)-methyltransferase
LLKIVQEALFRVDQGLSERSAVASAVSADLNLEKLRGEALNLTIETLGRQDLLDKILQQAFPATALRGYDSSLARLTAELTLRNGLLNSDQVHALRKMAQDSFRPELEYLLGFLPTVHEEDFYDGLSERDTVALRTHHPTWWVDYCCRLFGRGEAVRLLGSGPRPRYVRINPLRNRGRLSVPFAARRFLDPLSPVGGIPGTFLMPGNPSALSPFFEKGLFQVQDLASYLAVIAAEPMPRDTVLDLCGAPGAKTTALAQLMRNRGRIVSVDYSRLRMRTWTIETRRLGVKIASPVVGDASRLGMKGSFDLVLVDPPCSGTGILDRNPRMKWHLTLRRVERFAQLQTRILEEAVRLTNPLGRILYCTCSLTIEENEDVVSRFLSNQPEFETRPVLKGYGSPGLRGMRDCRRFYPHRDRMAGYFIARLERIK